MGKSFKSALALLAATLLFAAHAAAQSSVRSAAQDARDVPFRQAAEVSRRARLVEEVQIEGNRRLTDKEILRHVKTRPGDAFDESKARRDLRALLGLRLFDKTATRVSMTAGPRGGVVVIFTVMELPVVRDVTFVGLGDVKESEVWRALREKRLGVEKESIYDPIKVREAALVIDKLLASRGRPGANVEATVEQVSSQSVVISFKVTDERWF